VASAIHVAGALCFDSSATDDELGTDNGLFQLLLVDSKKISAVEVALAADILSPTQNIIDPIKNDGLSMSFCGSCRIGITQV
jgi:hypothetical protein